MTQYGFYFDATNCIGCHTCQVACKDVNRLDVGQNFRRVTSYCSGSGWDVHMYHIAMGCNHCAKPACVANCPTGAMYKDEGTGLVLHDDEACIGCESCVNSCPYGEPVLIEELGIVRKCDGCAGLRLLGEEPSCVASCPQRVLEFGDIEELRAAHPEANLVSDCYVVPDSSETTPSLLMEIRDCMLDSDCDSLTL
ncbi:4Fe-4S dicluster domain-containing protein [Eggerthella sinensis]|uniref:4Fe-4S dicluster domain-containing protein n=1 Tax=Eggerthella sinensis TaxID=242230 RepID=UPI0022E4D5F6|nr:4Fe-4S dicluster domain-containing protein [Eggerthella sinensis]